MPASLFDESKLRADLERDLEAVRSLADRLRKLDESQDSKVACLADYLSHRDPREHKTIVFTQFADTAHHLGRVLATRFGRTDVATGASGGAMRLARRFSPISNRAAIAESDELDLLISTDALSEGVNLQDADTLINYDIHWNPVRLIQRAGRIDRIGSENEEIHVSSFLPEAGLESELGLGAVLRHRIREFLTVFGEDSQVLPADDQLDANLAMSAFTGRALEEPEDDMDGLSRHVERLLHLRRKSPAEYDRILQLRPARHAFSQSAQATVGAARLGRYWTFWTSDHSDALKNIEDVRGLDLLYAHAQAPALQDVALEQRRRVGDVIDRIRAAFGPLAEAFRDQRLRPQLSAAENFVLERLETYERSCLATRRPHVEEIIAWVRGGYAQTHLGRRARAWRKENLPPEALFNETRVLFSRFPPAPEDLGTVEVLGAVAGLLPR